MYRTTHEIFLKVLTVSEITTQVLFALYENAYMKVKSSVFLCKETAKIDLAILPTINALI